MILAIGHVDRAVGAGRDAAARLDMPVAHVFVAKYRVKHLLRQEVLNLDPE